MCVYLVGLKSFNRKYEMTADMMMDREVANPLRMLSAYLMTTATTNPPRACKQITLFKNMLPHFTDTNKNTAANKWDVNNKVTINRNITFKPVREQLCR